MAVDKQFKDDVLSGLRDVSAAVGALDKKLDLHVQKMDYELSGIRVMDEQQNKLIDQHIEGVKTLRSIFEAHEKVDEKHFQDMSSVLSARITVLEAPRKWIWQGFKYLSLFGAGAASLAGFFELVHYLANRP